MEHVNYVKFTGLVADATGTISFQVNDGPLFVSGLQLVSTAPVTLPLAPTGPVATPGNAQVVLSWTASSGATGYKVKRSTTSGTGYATIGTPGTAAYADTSAVNGTTYYYVVSATNSAGESVANSPQVSATPKSSANEMLSFGPGATISGNSIAWTVPNGTAVTSLAPTFTISALATASPVSGTSRNFTTPQTYTVTAQDLTTKTYTVTVTAVQNQTLNFGALAVQSAGNRPLTLSASASSGLAVSYTSANAAVATVSSNILTIVGPGTSLITASQAGNATYAAAAPVAQTLTVNAAATSLSVTPSPLAFSVRAGESASLPVQLANSTSGAVDWNLGFVDASGNTNSLESMLAALDASGTALNGPLPSRLDFTEGDSGTYISTGVTSGSTQIFNQGNKLTTNLGGPLAYSNDAVASSAILGSGARYFTRKLPGLVVFAADLNGVSWVEVAGTIAYGSSRQTSDFTLNRDGRSWSCFAAKTVDYWHTINHLVMVDQFGLTHSTGTSASDEIHRISGLSGTRRIYHLLFVTSTTTVQPDSVFQDLANRLLDVGPGTIASVMSASPASGTAPAAGASAVTATANAFGLAPGTFTGSLATRAPTGTLLASVPVSLEVTAARLVLPTSISYAAVKGMVAATVNTPVTSSLAAEQTWSASLPGAPSWLSLVAASGTTPVPLGLRFDPGTLPAGTYRCVLRIVSGPATFDIPVLFRVDELALTKFLPDPARPVVYAINKTAKDIGQVLELDALTHRISRSVTDQSFAVAHRPWDVHGHRDDSTNGIQQPQRRLRRPCEMRQGFDCLLCGRTMGAPPAGV